MVFGLKKLKINLLQTCASALAAAFLGANPPAAIGQNAHESLRDGDRQFDKKEYAKAEEHYRKALDAAPANPNAAYNTGSAAYHQGHYDQAAEMFEKAVQQAKTPAERADALHNLGNAFFKTGKYSEAVKAYENSLRNRPADPDTRWNLQMAKKKLQAEQQNQQQKQQQQPQNQPQQQQQDQQKQQQEQEQQQQQGQGKGQGQQQQQQKQAGKISPEEAKRLLETAIEPEDRKNAKKYRQQPRARQQSEKDW